MTVDLVNRGMSCLSNKCKVGRRTYDVKNLACRFFLTPKTTAELEKVKNHYTRGTDLGTGKLKKIIKIKNTALPLGNQ